MLLKIIEKVIEKYLVLFNMNSFILATHNCIIMEAKLFHTDGHEGLSRR